MFKMADIQSTNKEFRALLGKFVRTLHSKYDVNITPRPSKTEKENVGLETEIKTIHNKTTNLDIEFLVPKIHTVANPQLKNNELLERYLEHRHSIQPWLPRDNPKFNKKYTMELQAVLSCFPLVWDETTLLAITVCFAVQCEVDDLLEVMDVGLVRECLVGHQRELREYGVIGTPKDAVTADSLPEVKVHHMLSTLTTFMSGLLPLGVVDQFLVSFDDLVESLVEETQYRDESPEGVEPYLNIRYRTIGTNTLLTLIAGETMSPELHNLMSLVGEAVGLQNDLNGLDKDIKVGEILNYVFVASGYSKSRQEPDLLVAGIKAAEKSHASSVIKALDLWKGLKGEDRRVGLVMVTLLTTHIDWSVKAARYASGR